MAKDLLQPERQKAVINRRVIARVVDIDDADRLLRVKIRILEMHPETLADDDLPWAEFAPPPGNRDNAGTFMPVEPDDHVWVDFPYDGDIRRPRILGSVHYAPDSEPYFPHEAWVGPDALEHKRIVAPQPGGRNYGKNLVVSIHGIVIEVKDDNAVIVTQRKSGTAIEITKDADLTMHSEGNIYIEARQNIIMTALGNILITAGESFVVTGQTGTVAGARSLLLAGGGASITLANSIGECEGDFFYSGNIDANGHIIDGTGNTNHHSHD